MATAEIVVTPGQLPGASAVPFFEDDRQHVRAMQLSSEDGRLRDSLERFLKGTLDTTGEYGRRYLAVFGAVPTYEALRPLVFPTT